jgi:hypothetical protein
MPVFGVSVRGAENEPSGVGPADGGTVPDVAGGGVGPVGQHAVWVGVPARGVETTACVGIGKSVAAGLGVGVELPQPITKAASSATSGRKDLDLVRTKLPSKRAIDLGLALRTGVGRTVH